MSYDMGVLYHFDIASLVGGFLTGVTITLCIVTLVSIWRHFKR